MLGDFIGLVGMMTLLGIAVLLSSNRKAINWRIVATAFVLQIAVGVFVLYSNTGIDLIIGLSKGVQAVIDFSRAGIDQVFGPLASDSIGFSYAVHVLPVIIFFSALMSVLYHVGIMQWIVRLIGGGVRFVIGTSSVESLNAAGNIFFGMTETPLIVRPYLKSLTDSQMFAVMTSGLASVAGVVLVAYVLMGAKMEFLLAASFMSAPGGLLMAKILMPDDAPTANNTDTPVQIEKSRHVNVILAAATGASDGVRLAVSVGGMLIAFVALISLLNGAVGGLAALFGVEGLTIQSMLGWLFAPLMYLIGAPWSEAQAAGALFGEKIILNEFVAFSHIDDYLAGMSEKTRAIVTFSLCGFANFASIAVLLGGLGALVPEKREFIARLGIKAVAAGSLSNLMSAALAGMLLSM